MRVFIEVHGLLELEQAGKWDDAKKLLYNLWHSDKKNVDKLCRLLSECWYVLSEWECCVKNGEASFQEFKGSLLEATLFGLTYFKCHPKFLWVAGYMIHLFPYLFCENDQDDFYVKWEQRGRNMLLHSTQIMPENLIARVLYLGTQKESAQYIAEKKQLSSQVNDFFSGQTAIEKYFKEVLSV